MKSPTFHTIGYISSLVKKTALFSNIYPHVLHLMAIVCVYSSVKVPDVSKATYLQVYIMTAMHIADALVITITVVQRFD